VARLPGVALLPPRQPISRPPGLLALQRRQ